jgi:OmpR-family two-component system manganese-sensing sensor histidine kinase
MSLRARLAVLYTSIVGGILLIFGVAVYGAVSFILISQVDSLLQRTVEEIFQNIYVDTSGDLKLEQTTTLDLSPGILFQIWSRDRTLIYSNIPLLDRPLDQLGLQSSEPVFQDSFLFTETSSIHLRVLTVPLVIGGGDRLLGALQVGTSLAVVDATQQSLLVILFVGVVVSMSVAGLGGWYSTRRALAPLCY